MPTAMWIENHVTSEREKFACFTTNRARSNSSVKSMISMVSNESNADTPQPLKLFSIRGEHLQDLQIQESYWLLLVLLKGLSSSLGAA